MIYLYFKACIVNHGKRLRNQIKTSIFFTVSMHIAYINCIKITHTIFKEILSMSRLQIFRLFTSDFLEVSVTSDFAFEQFRKNLKKTNCRERY